MPSLQPYINWSCLFDNTGLSPQIILTDTSSYPTGLPEYIKGNFTITQPDGLTRSNSSITVPDIQWNGTSLNQLTLPLRLDCNGNIQYGLYIINYTSQAPNSPGGYSSGYMIRSFEFVISPLKGIITPNFDVFTPNLSATDASVYTQAGFTDIETRNFTGLIASNGVLLSTTGTVLSLSYNGQYIDSSYTLTLNTTVLYTGNPLTWLTAKFNVYAQMTANANTPPSCSYMIDQLTTFKNQQSSAANSCPNTTSSQEAESLLNAINTNLASKTYTNLYSQIVSFENIVTYNQYSYSNTGQPIPAYVYNCGSGSSGGGGTSIGNTTVSFTVGDPGYTIAGQSSVTIPSLSPINGVNQSIVIYTKGGTPQLPNNTNYNFTPSSGTITMLNGAIFSNGEQIYIYAIYNQTI